MGDQDFIQVSILLRMQKHDVDKAETVKPEHQSQSEHVIDTISDCFGTLHSQSNRLQQNSVPTKLQTVFVVRNIHQQTLFLIITRDSSTPYVLSSVVRERVTVPLS